MKGCLLSLAEFLGRSALFLASLWGLVSILTLAFGFGAVLHGERNAWRLVGEGGISVAYLAGAWLHWLRPRRVWLGWGHLVLALGMCGTSAVEYLRAREFLATYVGGCGNPAGAAMFVIMISAGLAGVAVTTVVSAGLRGWLGTCEAEAFVP
jgi:hypothetical protein